MEVETKDSLAPATFSDAAGREWEALLNYRLLTAIRDDLAVDLGNVEQMGRTWAELLANDLKALDTLWLSIGGGRELAAPKGAPRNVPTIEYRRGDKPIELSKDEWLEAMDGNFLEFGRDALHAAIENFTPPLKRNLLRQGMGAVVKAWKACLERAETDVRNGTDAAIARALDQTPALGKDEPKSSASLARSTRSGRSARRTKR